MNADRHPTTQRRVNTLLIGMAFVLLGMAWLRLCVGQQFGWPQGDLIQAIWRLFFATWAGDGGFDSVMDIRLTRLALAVIVGASLATSGVALQALLRNPLAEPFILGLSSGAAVGVMVQMLAGRYLSLAWAGQYAGPLLGATASMFIVFTCGRRRGMIDPLGLLLVGVVLSTINGAIIVLLNYLPGSAGLREDLARWMMGYLNESVMGTPTVLMMTTATTLGFAVLWQQGRAMDIATFSDAEAVSLGVNLPRLRVILFVIASALAAGAVVLAGPIAFVGLICPHLARLLLGPSHRTLLLASVLLAAMLILLADMATVVLDFGQGRLPLGIFTAVIGGPVFIWMLRPQLGRAIS